MAEEKLIQIKKIVADFLSKTKITNFEVAISEPIADGLNVSVSARDANLLIGEGGQNIADIESLLRLVVKKQIKDAPFIHLDVNNYRGAKDELLRDLARKSARRARFYKQPVTLETMSAYNRRIIHTELATHPDIQTESIGEGKNRRVIVRYIN